MMSKYPEDKSDPGGEWQDFVAFVWFQAQLIFWCMSLYVSVQLLHSFTGRLI
jgi:hypothetical protein